MVDPIIAPFVWSIVVIGIGVMVRAIKIPAALLLFGMIILTIAMLPYIASLSYIGRFVGYVPFWFFIGICIVIAVNILRVVFGILFGQSVADSFTAKFLFAIFTPIVNIVNGILRTIFRIR